MLLGASPALAPGAWTDQTAGLPPTDVVTARDMGLDADKRTVLQDELGRVFVGASSLLVFDGQSWTAHAKPSSYALTSLVRGQNGILWATTLPDFGYFQEDPLGTFKYQSLVPMLPESARALNAARGCAPIGAVTYFITKDQLFRWDGQKFQITPFPTKVRLAIVRNGREFWLHHNESGLYQLTEAGPVLIAPAERLAASLVMGLLRDQAGLITVSSEGLARVGTPTPFSSRPLNQYLEQNRVSSVAELSDGNIAIGTVSGGLVLANRAGEIVRIWSGSDSGLPGREVTGLVADNAGNLLGTTTTDLFHLHATGESTVFNPLNGLKWPVVNDLALWHSSLLAVTNDGSYQQETDAGTALFKALPNLAGRYTHLLPCAEGVLLSRFRGVDWFDGTDLRTVYPLPTNTALFTRQSRHDPKVFYVAEANGLGRLTRNADGSFTGTRFLELPDTCASLHEDTAGKLWIGTVSKGVFSYDPGTRQLAPLNDPATGLPLQGLVRIAGNDNRILFFPSNRVLRADALGRGVSELTGLPAMVPSVLQAIPESDDLLIAYQQPADRRGPLRGAAVLSFAPGGAPRWRELDLRALGTIDSIRAATFARENGRLVLWLGGMQGILRLDYEKIATLLPPATPVIKIADLLSGPGSLYPYHDHRVQLRVFTGDYALGQSLLLQTRLGAGAWSVASARHAYDYTNLTDGDYRFEVRAVNSAGLTSPAATFVFRVLPPWYRSGWAFTGYIAALALGIFGYIRVRERRIQARNQELETLVGVRTAELVKASAAKDEFLAGVSHEIRNPMNGVIGIADNFRTDGLDAESRRKFGLLRQCANHLSSLLEDILDFSKVQAGAIELDPKPFDLPELVESVAAITRTDSEKYGIPVGVAVSPAVPRRLVGDARRIRQILINFVSNALKFSGRGEVTVTVWCKASETDRTEVIFAVSDEGPGISAEEQARLFTRFERGAAAQKGRVPGTGLGLALCKGLAAKMGGRIWLESEPGQGSCFYFSAPFAHASAPAEPAPVPAPAAPAGARAALVVDDQEYNRIVLVDLLQSLGFAVQSAQDGEAALALAGRQAFDAVFLDFNLPGLSGVDVARGIRALPNASAHALMLATTAFTTPEKRAQCLDAGMDVFLGKPVTKERLTAALARILNPTPSAPAPAPVKPAATRTPAAPADPLGNLRLLARKKGVPLADELALYFSELDAEVAQLAAAMEQRDPMAAGKAAHLLCGRCSFIYERGLEQVQRQIETAAGEAQWDEAQRRLDEFAALLADRRVSLATAAAAVPGAPRA